MSETALAVHRSTAATVAGASGALLVLTIIVGMAAYVGAGRKIRQSTSLGPAEKYLRLDARRILVATLLVAAALFVLFLTTMAIRSS